MKVINFADTPSVVSQYMSELRDVNIQGDMMRFRRNLERIGEIIAYEISKTIAYDTVPVETPLGTSMCHRLSTPLVLGTIFRAGLPFHQGFLKYFDSAENAFVSAYRKYKEGHDEFDIYIEYIASPRLENKTLILADPMLATGSSMELSYRALLTKGVPAATHLAAVIASRKAVDFVAEHFPEDTTLWVGAIDDEINAHSYIVPGLGDAGDLAYGIKE
ncbi:MAG: uracil phosphoribosyltransferase [Muribaculaceae bacterium]|nr:uracil phosphoribosyltransferase [Muribaculaceae bacterium]